MGVYIYVVSENIIRYSLTLSVWKTNTICILIKDKLPTANQSNYNIICLQIYVLPTTIIIVTNIFKKNVLIRIKYYYFCFKCFWENILEI